MIDEEPAEVVLVEDASDIASDAAQTVAQDAVDVWEDVAQDSADLAAETALEGYSERLDSQGAEVAATALELYDARNSEESEQDTSPASFVLAPDQWEYFQYSLKVANSMLLVSCCLSAFLLGAVLYSHFARGWRR